MATRSVAVDDSSSRITYHGSSWFADQGSQDQAGNFGPPYRSTLHGTQSNASASFSFTGTPFSMNISRKGVHHSDRNVNHCVGIKQSVEQFRRAGPAMGVLR